MGCLLSRRVLRTGRQIGYTAPLVEEATGFFLVRADSLDEAVSLASGCPHLAYGGRITVSEVARRAG